MNSDSTSSSTVPMRRRSPAWSGAKSKPAPLSVVSADHRRTKVPAAPRRIRQWNGRTSSLRSRSVQVGSEPTVHFGDRSRKTKPSCSLPHTRKAKCWEAGPRRETDASFGAEARTMRFAFRAFVATSGRKIRRGPRPWTAGISREDLARSRVPVNVVGRSDHQPGGRLSAKSAESRENRLHLLIGFDDYPKATGTTHKSRRGWVPSRITAQVSENHLTGPSMGLLGRIRSPPNRT